MRGYIFDLDGTLVQSSLDFAAMRAAVGCPQGQDILHYVASLAEPQRSAATAEIARHELLDAQQAHWMPFADDVLSLLRQRDIPVAIVTRNNRQATATKMAGCSVPIDCVLTREDALPKPHPQALLQIARRWQIPCQEIVYIGDYYYDLAAAKNANMAAWLYGHKDVSYAHLADRVLPCFQQLYQELYAI
ncbi:HAD-IA family hydrolase [Aestuariibacter halophilus]|uniref:HAD-IA family hydrolase n=1 Tax=Fluctibacter halophilus TaxID=226011 RepID=A0ABS8G6A0_9ALTE|nr:HAD-IA family hydrolase [Aestuariibacter halophilus]MCC2616122.1 HAD-IA family hydrolase [Aestuariibacter halophilus]